MGVSFGRMMKLMVVGLLILGLSYVQTETKLSDESSDEKKAKVFSLFTVVNFPNDECTAKSDTTMKGTCFTSSECGSKSGTSDGNCAAGFGVCCTFTVSTCGTSVTRNRTYIENPSYPTTYTTTGSCSYTVTPVNSEICQLRLDFDNLSISYGSSTGLCTDSFAMTGPSGQNPLNICGVLTNQHIYIENARSTSTTTLAFTIASGGTWKIKVSQIECSNLARGVPDCDQYMTGISGAIWSYNWPYIQLRNKDFTFCIRREFGYCGIQYTQALPATSPDSFALDDAGTGVNLNGRGNLATSTQGYIAIPSAPIVSTFSGGVFAEMAANTQAYPAAVTVDSHLFRIDHVGVNVADAATATTERGFKLDWAQIPCSQTSYGVTS